ncbi:portal protein [Lysobacter sp. ESA13C]|uniref:portal protein n=1 Tax=Lysobacter sp. ESA13C TaxID=2862676 RepID=UPI001CBFD2EB|nr:portal protein [Lysobacter sp. ESA13C]
MAEAAALIRRLGSLKSQREPLERIYRDCMLFVDPYRADGWQGSAMTGEQAQQQQALLTDSTGPDSYRMLAASVKQGVTPSNSRWFGMEVGHDTDEERQWLDLSAETLWENIHNSNYDAESFEAALDLVGAGWFVMLIDEDAERGGLVFTSYPLSECYVASSRADGRPDTLYRSFRISAEQAVNDYGAEAVSEQVRKLAADRPDELVEFLQAIYPRSGLNHRQDKRLAKNLSFASCHVECATQRTVRESGFHECPFIAPRWKRIQANSAYGIGPIAVALPDIKTLNMLVRYELDAAALATSGMWIAEDDGVLNPRTVKVGPKKVIVANSVDSMKPLMTGADFNVTFSIKGDLQRSIRKVMMSDQLEPKDGPAMTATEVHVRVNLIRQLLGPVYGRLQAEWLQPMIERCFGLAFRAGVFTPPPESLQNRDYFVTYVSPMARAQKLEDVSAMDRYEVSLANSAASLAQIDPQRAIAILDNYDFDVAARKRAELLGVPQDAVPTSKIIAKVRQLREQATQAAQQQAVLQQAATSAADAAGKKMGETAAA